MMSSIFYGEIKEDKLQTWSENRDPYDILVENNRVERLGGWDFIFIAKDLFTDQVQVDWGSFAYKCTKKQLQKLIEEKLPSAKAYAVNLAAGSVKEFEVTLGELTDDERKIILAGCLINFYRQ